MTTPPAPWVAVVGDNTVDRYLGEDSVEYSGGNAFNVAVQLARQGVPVRYFGAVGPDDDAQIIRRGLQQNAIALDDLEVLPGETAVTIIRVEETGDRVFEREDFGVTADYFPGVAALEAIASAAWVHIGMLPRAGELRERLAAGRARRPGPGPHGSISQDCAVAAGFEHLDVAFLSAGEGADAAAIAAKTVGAGVPLAVVTRGADGSLASDGTSTWTQDAVPAEVVDTTGAGDSFIAGFIAARLRGDDVAEALGNGARRAALTVSHPAGWPHPEPGTASRDALYAAVDAAVDEFAADAMALLIDLVAVRSVNPLQPGVDGSLYAGEEKRANELLAEAFRPLGFRIDWVEAAEGRPNLVAILPGAGGGRSLALNGHIDTVSPQAGRFDDPWTAVVEDGWLYGLGATDMKAGHAAMWLAARALEKAGIRLSGDLHIHSVVGEETMSHEIGTTAILEAGHLVDGVIIPEPTSTAPDLLRVANAAAGNYLFSVAVRGKSTHWASRNLAIRAGGPGDEIGVNAIDKVVQVYNAMRQLEEQWAFTKTHPSFPAGAFIIHPGVLRADIGVEAAPYFPDRARIDYLLSFPPGFTSEEIAAEVEEHIGHAAAMDPWLREHPVEFTWTDTWPPAYTDPDGDFARSVMASRSELAAVETAVPPLESPVTAAAQSDANFYEAYGIPALVCGPGDVRVAHAADERVAIANIALAARMMARVAIDWCGVDQT
jgi:acetylornithine deacetylase